MKRFINICALAFTLILFPGFFSSCSNNDDVRLPSDLLGVWSPGDNFYLEFCDDNVVHNLQIEYQDGESIGIWTKDVYYYEPGYNLVIYVSSDSKASVYEIISKSSNRFTWCWVEDIERDGQESVGQMIGHIINQAQEGFNIDPELFQTFNYIPQNKFFQILEDLDINYPWIY